MKIATARKSSKIWICCKVNTSREAAAFPSVIFLDNKKRVGEEAGIGKEEVMLLNLFMIVA